MPGIFHNRYVITILFTALYIALGFVLKLEAVSYLLLGIPLSLGFQMLVARKPFHQLWLRDSGKFHLNKAGWIITFCFMAFPAYKIIEPGIHNQLTLMNLFYYTAAMAGAVGAGYCYGNFSKRTTRDFLLCFGIIAVVRISLYFFPFVSGKQEFNPDYMRGIKSLLTYIPVAFIVEEVVFRGMLDTYIQPSKKTNDLWSALFISCLWGLWHLPLSMHGKTPYWVAALPLMTISLWGIVLSVFWRRTGNLAVPGFSHAFADAVRDCLK
jgi:membrane protease YdiL (CAAX protease family)